jgi:hypothetical protein
VCGCVGVWVCGCVGVWVCGCVGVWVCGCVGMWVWGCGGTVRFQLFIHSLLPAARRDAVALSSLRADPLALDVGCWMLDVGRWALSVGCSFPFACGAAGRRRPTESEKAEKLKS